MTLNKYSVLFSSIIHALLLGGIFGGDVFAENVTLFFDQKIPQIRFSVDEICLSLKGKNIPTRLADLSHFKDNSDLQIVLFLNSENAIFSKMKTAGTRVSNNVKDEGFCIRVTSTLNQKTIWVVGKDAAGVMYGGLELAEIIRISGINSVQDTDQNPYMAMRGTKFNCPLDVRTPSYSDACDAAQNNIAEMWNFDFWKEYIDNLACYRFNYISLWSLHPFPSLVKVPDYPEVALNDVQRSTVDWEENYSLQGRGLDAPEILNNVEIVKKMSIDEKIEFWRKVMAYGKSRHVDFYFVTWNIFVNGTFGKYGITDNIKNKITVDYFRKSVKQMFLTYPDLKGIGLTTGENMPGATFEEKEDWAFNTYALGVLDATEEMPGRKITFIHRQHMSGALDIAKRFKPLIAHKNIDFIFSFKYARAHVYSSTMQTFHQGFVKDIQGEGNLKTIWTLRNDDIYYFRWGAPDFVREFFLNIPFDVSRGYYYGSDQYIWGREFLSQEPETPPQIEIVKHWYQWMMWGRLGYHPHMSNEKFIQILHARYPQVSGKDLFTAWQEASMIYPKTTGFHWGPLDFQWYIESSKSRPGPAQTPSGFHDVNRFISLPPHPATDFVSIPNYVNSIHSKTIINGTTPLEVSNQVHQHADNALKYLENLSSGGNKELRQTLDDIRTIAYLGKYYAYKIRGATELAIFRQYFKKENRDAALENLRQAAFYWRQYASMALSQNKNPLWTNRVGYVNWRELFFYVLYDLTIAGGNTNIPSMLATPGGKILEAEDAKTETGKMFAKVSGYTGSGYLDFQDFDGTQGLEWTYQAEETGSYILELRYSSAGEGQFPAAISINGKEAGNIILWYSVDKSTWVWDRKVVYLQKGRNIIQLKPAGSALLDHLNVIYTGENNKKEPK